MCSSSILAPVSPNTKARSGPQEAPIKMSPKQMREAVVGRRVLFRLSWAQREIRMGIQIGYSKSGVEAFCRKWQVAELSLFGSALSDQFRPDSDVDILVTFAPDAGWSLMDWADMVDELEEIFGRPVDLVEKQGLRNPFRRKAILDSAQVIHAA